MSGKVKSSSRKDNKNETPFIKIIIGSVVSSILYFIIIALYAVFALKSGANASGYMPVGMVLGALTGFLCGFVAVRPIKQKGVLYGSFAGFVQALICMLVLFDVNNASAGNGIFILSAIIVLCAAVGGVAAVNMKKRKKY